MGNVYGSQHRPGRHASSWASLGVRQRGHGRCNGEHLFCETKVHDARGYGSGFENPPGIGDSGICRIHPHEPVSRTPPQSERVLPLRPTLAIAISSPISRYSDPDSQLRTSDESGGVLQKCTCGKMNGLELKILSLLTILYYWSSIRNSPLLSSDISAALCFADFE